MILGVLDDKIFLLVFTIDVIRVVHLLVGFRINSRGLVARADVFESDHDRIAGFLNRRQLQADATQVAIDSLRQRIWR